MINQFFPMWLFFLKTNDHIAFKTKQTKNTTTIVSLFSITIRFFVVALNIFQIALKVDFKALKS